MTDFESMLSDTQDRVGTAQLVLSKVEHGLETVERLEVVAKRTRPVLRSVSIVILGCLAALAIGLVIRRSRGGYETEIQEGESPNERPAPAEL